MVAEDENLGVLGNFGENGKRGGRAGVVELDQNVIHDERQGFAVVEVDFQRGEAKC